MEKSEQDPARNRWPDEPAGLKKSLQIKGFTRIVNNSILPLGARPRCTKNSAKRVPVFNEIRP
jgi:hypothetical protein